MLQLCRGESGNLRRAYSGAALQNPGSMALHEGLGFSHLASYHEAGFKFGQCRDVNWYEKDVSSS